MQNIIVLLYNQKKKQIDDLEITRYICGNCLKIDVNSFNKRLTALMTL